MKIAISRKPCDFVAILLNKSDSRAERLCGRGLYRDLGLPMINFLGG